MLGAPRAVRYNGRQPSWEQPVLFPTVTFAAFFVVVLAASVLPLVVAWNAPFPVADEREAPART